jgi:hypothetical protein
MCDMTKERNVAIDFEWGLETDARFQRLIAASSPVLPAADSACEPGLIMRFSWGKVAEAHAGIGALMAGLNVV